MVRMLEAHGEYYYERKRTGRGGVVRYYVILTCAVGDCKHQTRGDLYVIAERPMLAHIATAHHGQTVLDVEPKKTDYDGPVPF